MSTSVDHDRECDYSIMRTRIYVHLDRIQRQAETVGIFLVAASCSSTMMNGRSSAHVTIRPLSYDQPSAFQHRQLTCPALAGECGALPPATPRDAITKTCNLGVNSRDFFPNFKSLIPILRLTDRRLPNCGER